MALYTDGSVSILSDLEAHDSAILDVSRTENIDLTTKLSLAEEEVGVELEVFLRARSAAGLAPPRLGQVVVTAPLRRWHSLQTLALVYGDAYESQLNDRYRGKWELFQRMSREARQLFYRSGAGIVLNPIPRAAPPVAVLGPIGSVPAGTYVIQAAWRDAGGNSGAASDSVVVDASAGEQIDVLATAAPEIASGFDVYAGPTEDETALQNAAPIAVAGSWHMPPTGLIAGPRPGSGQAPDYFIYHNQVIPRG